jgi:prevent-host-death family protein
MEMSIREAKAKFSEAVAAAERGESVVITKFGKPVAQIAPPPTKKKGLNFAAADAYLKAADLDQIEVDLWPETFDDTAFSRRVLGLDE